MLTIHTSSRFKRSYKKLPIQIKEDFTKKIEIFKQHPLHRSLNTHKLSGKLEDYHAFYLRDGFRVFFDFIESNIILLINIGNHDEYKKWSK